MKTRKHIEDTGLICTFHLENEIENIVSVPKNKPSRRIISTKKGKKAIAGLIDIEQNHNHSWYDEICLRAQKDPEAIALFYRGTKITFREMIENANNVAASLTRMNIDEGDTIPAFLSNTPETVYLLLAVNKVGAKIALMSESYNTSYLEDLIKSYSKKAIFITDNNYNAVKEVVEEFEFDNIVMSSLADSLPEDPTNCDEYEPTLDKYYHYDNLTIKYQEENNNIIDFNTFMNEGKHSGIEVESKGNLDTAFLVTFTSGSTKIGQPKQIIHNNRSLIVSGRFHDSELSGNPDLKGLRGMAHIHTDSNTNIITCISDNLMQLWTVALEPEYGKETALDVIFLNKPNYLNMTTSHLLYAFKEYLFGHKYHVNGKGRKMPWLFACFAVGESTSPGEEKFLNKVLRIAKAGSGVKINGFSLPYTTLSIGGGDCEHGGIYYTLWKALFDKINYFKLKNHVSGMNPEAYVQISAFKEREDGLYEECDYGEYGIIASNSATSMAGYRGNVEETQKMIITDSNGRDWLSNNVYGYIDELGAVHVKGRCGYTVPLDTNLNVPPYVLEDVINIDTKNILSCTVNKTDEDDVVINIQLQPDAKTSNIRVISSIINRFKSVYGIDIADKVFFRIMDDRNPYPLTASGKRSIRGLEEMKLNNTLVYCSDERSLQRFIPEKPSTLSLNYKSS